MFGQIINWFKTNDTLCIELFGQPWKTGNKQLTFCHWRSQIVTVADNMPLSPIQCKQFMHTCNFWSWKNRGKSMLKKRGHPAKRLIWFWSWSEFSIFLLCLFVIREIVLQSSNFTDESILLFCASLTLWNKNVVSYKEVSAAQVRFSSVCFSCNI